MTALTSEELLEAEFAPFPDGAARKHLESLLWPDGPNCPRRGVMGDRITKIKGCHPGAIPARTWWLVSRSGLFGYHRAVRFAARIEAGLAYRTDRTD